MHQTLLIQMVCNGCWETNFKLVCNLLKMVYTNWTGLKLVQNRFGTSSQQVFNWFRTCLNMFLSLATLLLKFGYFLSNLSGNTENEFEFLHASIRHLNWEGPQIRNDFFHQNFQIASQSFGVHQNPLGIDHFGHQEWVRSPIFKKFELLFRYLDIKSS